MELLDKKQIKKIMAQARDNMKRDKFLAPVIFAKLEKSERIALLPVELPEYDHENKCMRIFAMGEALRKVSGKKILEALYISDAYMAVIDKKHPETYDNNKPVREQADRKETIILTGRDITGKTRIFATQPYMRIEDNIIFEKPNYHFEDNSMAGLLDYFFGLADGRLSDYIMTNNNDKN